MNRKLHLTITCSTVVYNDKRSEQLFSVMEAETSFIEICCRVPVCYKFVQECLVKKPAFHKCNFSASFPPVFMDLPSGFHILLLRLEFQRITAQQNQVYLRLSWGSVHCSYFSNIELGGLTWVLLSVPIKCVPNCKEVRPKVNLRW